MTRSGNRFSPFHNRLAELSVTSPPLYLKALHRGRLADDVGRGRVWSKDVGAGWLAALFVVAITGVVPEVCGIHVHVSSHRRVLG